MTQNKIIINSIEDYGNLDQIKNKRLQRTKFGERIIQCILVCIGICVLVTLGFGLFYLVKWLISFPKEKLMDEAIKISLCGLFCLGFISFIKLAAGKNDTEQKNL